MDAFLVRAALGGLGFAVIAAPLGCFVIWRRVAFFGDALVHGALLGVALALVVGLPTIPAIFFVAVIFAALLVRLEADQRLPSDALLSILSHGSLAAGLIAVASFPAARVDISAYLYGDILALTSLDVAFIWGGALVGLIVLRLVWSDLLAATIDAEIAAAEGVSIQRTRLVFALLMAGVTAVGIKVAGILLTTALVVLPAATARFWSNGPERMVIVAIGFAVVAVIGGLGLSAAFDWPTGPAIVIAAVGLWTVSRLMRPK